MRICSKSSKDYYHVWNVENGVPKNNQPCQCGTVLFNPSLRRKDFETWARVKGMLVDKDESGIYNSLETRACFDTWCAAQQSVHPTDGGHSQADSESKPATISR